MSTSKVTASSSSFSFKPPDRQTRPHREADIVVVGSLNVNICCYADTIPNQSEIVIGNKFQISYGGKGGNCCCMCAKLGASVSMIGRVGGDCFGKEYVSKLKNLKVIVSHIKSTDQAATGICQLIVSENGKYRGVFIPNANYMLTATDVENSSKSLLKSAKVAIFTLEIPKETVLESMRIFKNHGLEKIILVSSGVLDKEFYELATIVITNEVDLEATTGEDVCSIGDGMAALKKLLSFGCHIAIATLGSWGALYVSKENPDNPQRVMVTPVDQAIDVSGASESFVGTFAYLLVYYPDMELDEKIKIACSVARETVTKYGTQDSYPFKATVAHLFPDDVNQQ